MTGSWRRGAISTRITCPAGLCSIEWPAHGSFETLTIDAVAHDEFIHDLAANTDPDGDCDGNSITIVRP